MRKKKNYWHIYMLSSAKKNYWFFSVLQAEVILLKVLFCKQKLENSNQKMQEHFLVYFNCLWQRKTSSAGACGVSVVM